MEDHYWTLSPQSIHIAIKIINNIVLQNIQDHASETLVILDDHCDNHSDNSDNSDIDNSDYLKRILISSNSSDNIMIIKEWT